ncbi:MAG: CoA-disulfide reductase [Planctomycetaceae bacterium]|jgi:NADPH-dependent 2,4-dienoyl-CoA reductase/sulfur reductase-like enzyme/peroxiredoxin family protein/rhodanese-related sulfurtransferase/TusA-related sulfurtransferase|nr:CoA-disulfide reductase [Planctomycetaceae bacterium]
MSTQKILIIGGVAGGATAAARLRRLDETARIVLFERDEFISFANCGLPYYIGGEITDKSALTLQTPEAFRLRYNIDVRTFNEVTAINRREKTVTVKNRRTGETYSESYDKLILSMGASPIRSDDFDSELIFTLRNIPDTYRIREFIVEQKPRTAVVVGGGYIGLEMAENLHRDGIEVSIVQRGDHVLAPLDYDIACDLHRHIEQKGVRLLLKNEVKSVVERDGKLRVVLNDGELDADMMILAIGVRPESSLAKEAGLDVNRQGAIVVSDKLQTSDADIYAVGDVIEITNFVTGQKGYIPLAGPANKQARIVADQLCGIDSRYNGAQGSSILRVFDMTAASTGLNETAARNAGIDYEKVFTWSPSHAGYYPGATSMSVKTLFEKTTGRVIGAQIVGYDGVDKRCDVIATAIRAKMTMFDLAELELCYAPPYSSAKDPVNMAGFAATNILTGKLKLFHWHDVAALQAAAKNGDSVVLLDVRTEMEYANGHIDGFVNIPLDELRGRLGELDRSKRIYVTCQVGVRGYAATRILVQNGFDAYDLSGGYRLWNSVCGERKKPRVKTVSGNVDSCNVNNSCSVDKVKIGTGNVINIDACGLQCPAPIMKLSAALKAANDGDVVEIKTSDPAFASDIDGFCRRTGSTLIETVDERGVSVSRIRKGTIVGSENSSNGVTNPAANGKNFIVFSGDLDKAIAAFIMANAAAAMGRKVSIFFTFWGLNILRKSERVSVRKDFLARMFCWLMPRGTGKLPLSKMNMGGIGARMIRYIMKQKNVDSIEDLIKSALANGVELIACSMSMDVMGIKPEELIDGVKQGGAAAMLAHAEESDMSLFI